MQPRQLLEHLFHTAVQAADPQSAMQRDICLSGPTLHFPGDSITIPGKIIVLGIGKASIPMATTLEKILGDRITDGLICCPYALPHELRCMRVVHGGHPLPDAISESAGREMLRLAASADEDTLVIVLISGGGSSAVVVPATGISLTDKRTVNALLLRCGANIAEVNTVRRHLSAIKGGWLARAIEPGHSLSLILSDVIGDDLSIVASGPTLPDSGTFRDAWRIIGKYALEEELPPTIKQHFLLGMQGQLEESPKSLDTSHHRCYLLGSNRTAVAAAAIEAERIGWKTLMLGRSLQGEAREVGRKLADAARGVSRPFCLVAGGETTVAVSGNGLGGRNQELALGFLEKCDSNDYLLSASTDGIDGPTNAAGAFADRVVLRNSKELGLSTSDYLSRNDSYHFFDRTGGLLRTGPTGTNVCDLTLIVGLPYESVTDKPANRPASMTSKR